MGKKITYSDPTVYEDSFVKGDYSLNIRNNLSNISHVTKKQKNKMHEYFKKFAGRHFKISE